MAAAAGFAGGLVRQQRNEVTWFRESFLTEVRIQDQRTDTDGKKGGIDEME